jgi:hypothetical protein
LHKVSAKNAHGGAQNAENFFSFVFLEQCHKDGNGFLDHIVQVTGDETWDLFMNVEAKGQ